ncbi:hypothetical protein G6674_01610 [Polynucleobacter paneuropaeus]|nr:hypothetical protein G6674_01610 [Polynucleobacter paneuropaeus]
MIKLGKARYLELMFSWLLVFSVLAVLIFVVSPYRGAFWFSDDGLFLRMSWEAANSYGWDRMQPQSPSYLFHSVWIKFGLTEYLHFRYLHYLFSFMCALVFFGSLIDRPWASSLFPAASLLSVLVSINSIESPNTLVLNFFLLAAGCYFFALKFKQKYFQQLFFALAGGLLALCGFMHAAVAIACVILSVVMIWIAPAARSSSLLLIFFGVLTILWAWYIDQIGLASLLQPPAAHDISIQKLIHRIWLLLGFLLRPLAVYCVSTYLYIYWMGKHSQLNIQRVPRLISVQLSWGVLFLAGLSVASYLFDWSWRFPGWRGILQVPGLIYYPLLFLIFALIQQHLLSERGKYLVRIKNLLNHVEQKQFIAILAFILLPAALAVGSNTAIIQGLVFFAGPATGLALCLWSLSVVKTKHETNTEKTSIQNTFSAFYWPSNKLFFLGWGILFAIFSLNYNHPSSRRVLEAGLSAIQESPLRGVYESRPYQDSLNQIQSIYVAQGCKHKTLLVLDYVPMLHYILKHPAPNAVGVMRPMYNYPQEKIDNALRDPRGWCVIDLTGQETQEDIQKNGGDRRAPLRYWLQMNGAKFDAISPGSELIGNISIYVK